MNRTIAVANQKGGVGKTTTAVSLAAALAVAEQRVLLVDLDPQGNASSGVGRRLPEGEPGLYEALIGRHPVEELVRPTDLAGLSVVPSSMDLVGVEVELLEGERRESLLRQTLEDHKEPYDFVILDCPPSLGLLTLNGLAAADTVLIPVQCEYYAMEGLGQIMNTVRRVQRAWNRGLHLEGILLTMYDGRNRLSHQVAGEIRDHFGSRVFQTVIPRNVSLAEAPSHGKPVMLYAVGSTGAQAYLQLAKEVLDHAKASVGSGTRSPV
jgi:chromosome partitioning protein